jgi:PAT family beta-lactamase induction signal transducer AmpG
VKKAVIVLLCAIILVTTTPMTLGEEQEEGEVVVVSVDSTNLRFSPDTITLNEGDTVRFLWSGELLAHNAVEENGVFDSGDPSRNVDYSYTFAIGENGTYEYVCEPHEDLGMVGTIIVEPLPINDDENETQIEDEENQSSDIKIGEGTIPLMLFSPWFLGAIVFVGFIALNRERFQLGVVLEDDIESIEEGDSSSEGKTLVDSYRARVFTLCALYVAQGIPWGFITVTFVTFLAARGVGAGELAGLLTLGTLPWSVKFLWGPIIDRYQMANYGRRRPWILLAQTGMVLMLFAMLFVPDPASNVHIIAIMFLIYNIFTSLQDVSTDALAVDVLKPHEMEKVNSYMFTSKTLGGAIGGAGLGTIIVFTGFKGAILLQIPILLGIMLAPLLMIERPGEKRFPWEVIENSQMDSNEITSEEHDANTVNDSFAVIFNKIRTAFSLRSAKLGVILSLSVSLSFLLIPILPLLFVLELGWSEAQFNATRGGWILIVTMIGYLVGGQLGRQFGGKSVIIYGAFATALSTSLWGISGELWDNATWMVGIWSIRSFGWSVVMINIYSLVMKVTWGEVGGTQFTAYMAMMNLSAIIGYQLTGPLANRFDYQTLLLIGAVLETLVIVAVLWIDPNETRRRFDDSSSVPILAEIIE